MKALLRITQRGARFTRLMARHSTLIQAVAGVAAIALGFWGWTIKAPPTEPAGWFNNFFRTIQLITLQFPMNLELGIPWQLQVARLAVPFVTALATLNLLLGAITRPLRLAMLPHAREHIVLSGAERVTSAALLTMAERDHQIVIVAPTFDPTRRETLEGYGLTCFDADITLPAAFDALNLSHAAALFLTHDDDLSNLNIAVLAMNAASLRPADAPPLVLGVMLDDEVLATELDAALDGIARRHGVRYYRLLPDREGIRLEMRRHAPVFSKADRSDPSRILVIGLTGRWQQVLAQLICAAQDHPDMPPEFTFVLDEGEAQAFEAWRACHPELALVTEINIMESAVDATPDGWRAPDLSVVLKDGADGVAAALALRRPSSALHTAGPILVRQSREDWLLGQLGVTQVEGRDLSGMIAFGGLLRAESFARVLDRKGEALAIGLHAHYLDTAPILGAGSPAALAAWDALPENLRDANRASADHAPILFAAIGLKIAAAGEAHRLTDSELDVLGRIEHRRWMADRIARGWRLGRRDNERLQHPSLLPFEALPLPEQEKDRAQVRAIVSVLESQGFSLSGASGSLP